MDLDSYTDVLDQQSGVVSRRQLLEGGATDADIRRWLRRRELRRVHEGVYVNHTGPLTWPNRAWAAVLYHWPAALTHQSCLVRGGEVIHVAVEADRTPRSCHGIRVHRLVGLHDRAWWHLGPPRVRLEDALLSMCGESDDRVSDLLSAGDGVVTLRLGWRHCETTPCRTASRLAHVLQLRGWDGSPRRCSDGCAVR